MIKSGTLLVLGDDDAPGEGKTGVYWAVKDFDLKAEHERVSAERNTPINYTVLVGPLIDHLVSEGLIKDAIYERHVLWGSVSGSADAQDLEDFYKGEQHGKG